MTSSGNRKEDVLEEYLSGDSGLARTYRQQAKEEPSTAVDAAVRAAARKEIKTGRRYIINPFGYHWTAPTSLAAMFLLSVGLVIFLSDETGVTRFNSDVLEEKMLERELDQPAARPADDKVVSPAPSSYGATLRRPEKKERQLKPAAPDSSKSVRKRMQPESTGKAKQKPGVQREPAGIQVRPMLQKNVAPAKPGTVEPVLQMEMESPAGRADSDVLAPELWLAQIKTLRAAGKIAAAEASLAEFRKIYPDYPVDSLPK